MKKQLKKQSGILGGIAVTAFVAALLLTIFGLSRTVVDIKDRVIARTPTAILASAGLTEDGTVSLPVVYYDQEADECVDLYNADMSAALYSRQFEWTECGYYSKAIEQGLVEFELGDDYLPVAAGGKLTPNRGVKGSSESSSNFARWWTAVDGKSKSYAGILKLNYHGSGAEFSFYKEQFYPLDEVEYDKEGLGNSGRHNHLFTMSFAAPFTVLASGNEKFEIAADDDTFVFVGDKLVIDLGGIHDTAVGRFEIKENGEVYTGVKDEEMAYSGVKLEKGAGSIVRIFHADRDSSESTFNVRFMEMNLTIEDTKMANNDSGSDGVQIAYDPTDPSYVAPLGESSVFRPDGTKGLIIMATVEGVLLVVFAMLVVASVRFATRRKNDK